jgi:hypothetical protein
VQTNMRFTKTEILAEFDRQDRSYRLAIISTHWLQGGAQYKPSAAEEARGLRMQFADRWVPFSDLSDILETDTPRLAVTSDFILNQLHALIRAPFELLSDYCEDADKREPRCQLLKSLKETTWYPFARIIRNAISHNFHFDFSSGDKRLMPITWNEITLTEDLNGQALTYKIFWHKPGYELFLEMRAFAEELPEISARSG